MGVENDNIRRRGLEAIKYSSQVGIAITAFAALPGILDEIINNRAIEYNQTFFIPAGIVVVLELINLAAIKKGQELKKISQ